MVARKTRLPWIDNSPLPLLYSQSSVCLVLPKNSLSYPSITSTSKFKTNSYKNTNNLFYFSYNNSITFCKSSSFASQFFHVFFCSHYVIFQCLSLTNYYTYYFIEVKAVPTKQPPYKVKDQWRIGESSAHDCLEMLHLSSANNDNSLVQFYCKLNPFL